MRIQFCSDLHLGLNPDVEFPKLVEPAATVLALLGDIGDPESLLFLSFINYCCRNWEQVLFVPGNHEFWRLEPGSTKTVESALDSLRSLEKTYVNFKLCWRTRLVSEDGVLVLATPLWSRPAEGLVTDPSELPWIDRDRTFDAALLSHLHETDLKWISNECKKAQNQTVVILTHYGPTLMLMERDRILDADVTLFASDLETVLRPPIVSWACGHTHQSVQWLKEWESGTGESGTILITSNPKGFPHRNPQFRIDSVLRIDPLASKLRSEGQSLSEMNYKSLE